MYKFYVKFSPDSVHHKLIKIGSFLPSFFKNIKVGRFFDTVCNCRNDVFRHFS